MWEAARARELEAQRDLALEPVYALGVKAGQMLADAATAVLRGMAQALRKLSQTGGPNNK